MSVILSPEETQGAKMRRKIHSRQASPKSFGCSTERFVEQLTIAPGVGRYDLDSDEASNLIISSPSVSKRGYISSFVSKTPKLPASPDTGVPGPCAYEVYQQGSIHSGTVSSLDRPSAMFVASGQGRVPFPPPNNVPGPAAYDPLINPGQSPLLKNKPSATFLSDTDRKSFIQVNDVPSAARYKPHLVNLDRLSSPPRRGRTYHGDLALPPGTASSPSRANLSPGSPIAIQDPRIPINGDVTFWKSTYTRFQDVGKDNKVPGPQRYFNEHMEQEYFPEKSLRTSGTYRGKYLGKLQSAKASPPHTFGADLDRFKDSVYGRLDLIAQIPGPGTYFEDIQQLSAIRATSPERSIYPVRSTRASGSSSPTTYATLSKTGSRGSLRSTKKPESKLFAKDIRQKPHSDYV